MHPMFCFVMLTAIVGINGQLLENVEPKKNEKALTAGIDGQLLQNVEPKKDLPKDSTAGVEGQLLENVEPQKDRDLRLEVLDVGRCRKAVKDFCPCGWAKCVPRKDYSCTNELTKCCPVNYDLKCCAERGCLEYCGDDVFQCMYHCGLGPNPAPIEKCINECGDLDIAHCLYHCGVGPNPDTLKKCLDDCNQAVENAEEHDAIAHMAKFICVRRCHEESVDIPSGLPIDG
uniref:Defensin-like protein n=1 Tax=Globodera pallida TaxID=36090 RepID=A0A183CIN7_GLOPA